MDECDRAQWDLAAKAGCKFDGERSMPRESKCESHGLVEGRGDAAPVSMARRTFGAGTERDFGHEVAIGRTLVVAQTNPFAVGVATQERAALASRRHLEDLPTCFGAEVRAYVLGRGHLFLYTRRKMPIVNHHSAPESRFIDVNVPADRGCVGQ